MATVQAQEPRTVEDLTREELIFGRQRSVEAGDEQGVLDRFDELIDLSFDTQPATLDELTSARDQATEQGLGPEIFEEIDQRQIQTLEGIDFKDLINQKIVLQQEGLPTDQIDQFISQKQAMMKDGRGERNVGRARLIAQGATLSFADEIEGVIRTAIESNPELENVEEFRMFRDQARESINKFREERPGEAIALEVGGGLALGAAGARAAGARRLGGRGAAGGFGLDPMSATRMGTELLGRLGRTIGQGFRRGAATGAAVTGIEGLGRSEADLTQGEFFEAITDAATGAVTGLVFGGAFGALAGRATRNKDLIRILQSEGARPDARVGLFKLDPGASIGKKVFNAIRTGSTRLARDPQAKEAIRQGFDEGVVSMLRGASREDRFAFRQMNNILRRGLRDPVFASTNRATDVAGRSVARRYNAVVKAKKEAGEQLDVVAKRLEGQTVDANTQLNKFITELDDRLGIKLDAEGLPIFKGSDIEGLKELEGPMRVLTERVNRLRASGEPVDARDLHRLKRFIDENVTFGKGGEGLSGATDALFKNFRRDIDGILDSTFDFYDKANVEYSALVRAKNAFDGVMGPSVREVKGDASAAIGTQLRGVLSNRATRQRIQESLDGLDQVANEFAGEFKDNPQMQLIFANELENVFGSFAQTGLASEVAKGVRQGATQVGEAAIQSVTGGAPAPGLLRAAGREIVDVSRTLTGRQLTQDSAMQAIRRLLTVR